MDYKLRNIPEEQYQKIKDIAEKEKRSINNQLLIMIEKQIAYMMSAQDGTKKQ